MKVPTMTTYRQHSEDYHASNHLPTMFLDTRELLTSEGRSYGHTTDGDFVVFLIEAINEAIYGNHSNAYAMTYVATLDTSERKICGRYKYAISLIANATSFDRDTTHEESDGVSHACGGPTIIGWSAFTTLADLEERLREILATVDPEYADPRHYMWSEYYHADQKDHDGNPPNHPEHDDETTPGMLAKHGWPEQYTPGWYCQ